MDGSELRYMPCAPEMIYDRMQDAYMDAGGDVLYPGDEKEMLLRAVQAVLAWAYGYADARLRMATLRFAVGAYLDLYGENRDCPRIAAAAAQSAVEIQFRATGQARVIPAGTALTADGERIYLLQSDVAHTGLEQTAVCGIQCSETGGAGNGLKSGTQMQFVNSEPAVVSVYTVRNATGGMDDEDDESYRARIRLWGLGNVTTGPSGRYESEAMKASSEIIDARATRTAPGQVGIHLILKDGADLESVCESVREKVNPKDVRPLTDQVSVDEAKKLTYALNVTCACDPASGDVSAAISAAVNEYQAWQDETIGRAFNPDRLVAMLYQAGASRVTIGEGSAFNGGAAEYTEIDANARCDGEIKLVVN